jgi:phenylalanyl-tRNA synthetase beta chain
MKVSLSWLKEYVPIEMDVGRLVEALTMAGLEVEEVSDRYHYLDRVFVGRITGIEDHPNADHLKVCSVDMGDRALRVVCGAPNVSEGMRSPLALPGTVFPDETVLQQNTIRGVVSEAMLCSEKELGLGPDAGGIMDLNRHLPAGKSLADALALSDTVLEIAITPNRPDCLSMIGIAREIAAIQKMRVRYPDVWIEDSSDEIHRLASVVIECPELCPRYSARMVVDVSIGPSPFWLQDRLMSVGLRPINNVVDITNFVLMESGQPLHAFDFDRLAGNRIVVRTAGEGEAFTTLDGKQRRLSADMCMICDAEKPVAVGGVMGGLNSEIEAGTGRVLIESAYFNPVSIRKTAKRLGLSSEASFRFERGADPEGTLSALNRAARLIAEIGGGKTIAGLIDAYPVPVPKRTIRLSPKAANRLLGTRFTAESLAEHLRSIEFRTETGAGGNLTVTPPSFRVDVTRPEDLMEEAARLSGYNAIPITHPATPAEGRPVAKPLRTRERIRDCLTGFGFLESIHYSFIAEASCDRLRIPDNDRRRNTVAVMNPLTEDQTVMRTSLVPGVLSTLQRNLAQQEKTVKVFEIGKVYYDTENEQLPQEVEMLAGLWSGLRTPATWHGKSVACDFYDLKGAVEGLLAALEVPQVRFTALPQARCHYFHPGRAAQILAGGSRIGEIGEIHPEVRSAFEIRQEAYVFELDVDRLMPLIPETKSYRPLPKYPAVSRDLTLIVAARIEAGEILHRLENRDESLVESVSLFDVFEGGPIETGKKSVSFRIVYRAPDRTLEDEEINQLHQSLTSGLIQEFNASLPT